MGQLDPEKLSRGSILGLDTVVFVYFLEQHPRHYATSKRLFRRIEAGDLTGIISTLVFAELLVPACRANDFERAEILVQLVTDFPNIKVLPLSSEISVAAARLRGAHGMRTPDAIHAATGLKMGAGGIITNDREFLKLAGLTDILLFDAD
ncbi:type II toxin-antitoxin system VapC family toxin [Desulfoferrobacter suflitae]|uniref:type II toxin-antitoxin system VapC family toxin n=1 Tax=Desulfoferrobacter suflitae TaxID=2865782 RepID=UPI00216422F9|nr:type II toxin-antitoxin system VapC family toxin [Desulfoferrobacter suflitae]MCK8603289.1 type II toxin-antitoxin system VapC family toxin [Desulfoferrobacter suflitae]